MSTHRTAAEAAAADKSKPYFPLASVTQDGYSNEEEATATCFCGTVQLAFPTKAPGLVDSFICNCTDCHKLTASMFGANFVVNDDYLKHLRGESNLTQWSNSTTIGTPNTMVNFFCKTCGSLLYRRGTGFPGHSILRIGTVDDFHLMETVLKPRVEQFTKDRVSWLKGVEGILQVEGYHYG
ncbi:hypothetical protein K402DRAFT_417168 [Aulographum hederae CBS 113979]|uniref:CENP-V/GFA domain-containing protein n=1 Tax=Aulographum hederae CBS 113979 TaxID=1176131 RepID=A0A6G1HDF9_9PEZI|nr:hypothetical protein K402DRAFT_417168 [Aulographum hederae CBS 113979]